MQALKVLSAWDVTGSLRTASESSCQRTSTMIISVRPSKQPLMVRTFLKVYMELGSYFLFLQEQIKDIMIIIPNQSSVGVE